MTLGTCTKVAVIKAMHVRGRSRDLGLASIARFVQQYCTQNAGFENRPKIAYDSLRFGNVGGCFV